MTEMKYRDKKIEIVPGEDLENYPIRNDEPGIFRLPVHPWVGRDPTSRRPPEPAVPEKASTFTVQDFDVMSGDNGALVFKPAKTEPSRMTGQ